MIRFKVFDQWYYCNFNRDKPFKKNNLFYYYNSGEIKVIDKIEYEKVNETRKGDLLGDFFYYEICNSYHHNHINRSSFQLLKMAFDYFNLNWKIKGKNNNNELILEIEGKEFLYEPEYAKLKLKDWHFFIYIAQLNFKDLQRIRPTYISNFFECFRKFATKHIKELTINENINYLSILNLTISSCENLNELFLTDSQKQTLEEKRQEKKRQEKSRKLEELKNKEKEIFKKNLEFIKFFKEKNFDLELLDDYRFVSQLREYQSFKFKEENELKKIRLEKEELESELQEI